MSDVVVFLRSQPRFGDQIVAYPALSLLKQFWSDKRSIGHRRVVLGMQSTSFGVLRRMCSLAWGRALWMRYTHPK